MKDRSWAKNVDMKLLRASSATAVCACMKRRAWRIWVAKRSVGVGFESRKSLDIGVGLEGCRSRGRSSYMGLRES